MARQIEIILEEQTLRIPEDAFDFDGFLRWEDNTDFPENGRIDFLAGDIEIDISPEDLYTHNAIRTAIVSTLVKRVVETDLGDLYSDRVRVRSRFAGLSVEPDLFVIFADTLKEGRIRLTPASSRKGPDRYTGVEGPPDIVLEIVSDSSVKKDTRRLPPLYARAGVPELWIVDARGKDIRFLIQTLVEGSYRDVGPTGDGWIRSPQLDQELRLSRRRADPFPWRYTLEHRSA